jgi:hypothetical protein
MRGHVILPVGVLAGLLLGGTGEADEPAEPTEPTTPADIILVCQWEFADHQMGVPYPVVIWSDAKLGTWGGAAPCHVTLTQTQIHFEPGLWTINRITGRMTDLDGQYIGVCKPGKRQF